MMGIVFQCHQFSSNLLRKKKQKRYRGEKKEKKKKTKKKETGGEQRRFNRILFLDRTFPLGKGAIIGREGKKGRGETS